MCLKNSKPEIGTKLKPSNFVKTERLELWQNSQKIETKLQNLNCDKTKKERKKKRKKKKKEIVTKFDKLN